MTYEEFIEALENSMNAYQKQEKDGELWVWHHDRKKALPAPDGWVKMTNDNDTFSGLVRYRPMLGNTTRPLIDFLIDGGYDFRVPTRGLVCVYDFEGG